MRRFEHYGPALIVLLTTAVVLLAGPAAVRTLTFAQTQASVFEASQRLQGNSILEQFNQASRDIAATVEPSVVHISAQQLVSSPRRHMTLSSGSGWVWDEDGHIITNHHVVKGASRIEVQMHSGNLREAVIVGADPDTDIAVLKVSSGELIPALRAQTNRNGMNGRDDVQQGDLVFAFGSPFDFRFSMSSGVVSGKGRSAGVIRNQLGESTGYENFIQVDAAINPGNSGGPLTNHRGEVIGMNTAIATSRNPSSGQDEGQFGGIGLAIPMGMIEPVVTQLIENGVVHKGYLGVNKISDSRIDQAERIWRDNGFSGNGVGIGIVVKGSPAAKAGVRVGDVVTHVSGVPVGTWAQFRSNIASKLPQDKVALSIWRLDTDRGEAEEIEVVVTLERLNTLLTSGSLPLDHPLDSIPEIGIDTMLTATEDAARRNGVPFHDGVLVTALTPDMPLERYLPKNSIIVEVQDRAVRSVEEFGEVLRQYNLIFSSLRAVAITPDGDFRAVRLQVPR